MTTENTQDNCQRGSASCLHVNTKRVAKFGKKCAMCHRRVWKFWKTRKCSDCKTVVHKSCIAARDNDAAPTGICPAAAVPENATAEATGARTDAVEATAASSSADPVAVEFRMYVAPRPWVWANITVVTVDCRRRPNALTVTVSHGHALTAAAFARLFEALPTALGRRPSARPDSPTTYGPDVVAWRESRFAVGDIRRTDSELFDSV